VKKYLPKIVHGAMAPLVSMDRCPWHRSINTRS